ncbi:hypothetical protein J6590_028423 [Homalodisca vitripennis]|nr:hypothetical protein J6590_028423 [Homalodisca vitripennis]
MRKSTDKSSTTLDTVVGQQCREGTRPELPFILPTLSTDNLKVVSGHKVINLNNLNIPLILWPPTPD